MRKSARGRSLGWAVAILQRLGWRVGCPLVNEALEIVRCAGLHWTPPDRSRPDSPAVGRLQRVQSGRDPLPSGKGSRFPKPVWSWDSQAAKRPRKPRKPETFTPVKLPAGNDAALLAMFTESRSSRVRATSGPLVGQDVVRGT